MTAAEEWGAAIANAVRDGARAGAAAGQVRGGGRDDSVKSANDAHVAAALAAEGLLADPGASEGAADGLSEAAGSLLAYFGNGGPDTPIRTTWLDGVECWEVIADDLRPLLDRIEAAARQRPQQAAGDRTPEPFCSACGAQVFKRRGWCDECGHTTDDAVPFAPDLASPSQAAGDRVSAAVEALHHPDLSGEFCDHCWPGPTRSFIPAKGTAMAEARWPCATIRALAAASEPTEAHP